jgi:putative MATE family efflux protein
VSDARRILSLAGSAFVVLAAEPLFLLVDTAVVGHLGRVPLAALGAAGTLMAALALVGTSLEYGTTGRAARWFGAGDRAAALDEGVQASWLAAGIGTVAVLLGELLASPVMRLVAHDPDVARAAAGWLRVAVLGLPFLLLVLAGNGWMRGVQDTRSPVRVVLVANALSAVVSPVLVFPAGLGLRGSAVANVLAQVVGALLCLRLLRRQATQARPRPHVMRRQLVVSRDLVIRSAAFYGSSTVAAAVAGRMGAAQLAAHQVGTQLWLFAALVLDSFAIAAQSLVGAALGGARAEEARHVAWRVARFGLWAGLGMAALTAAGAAGVPAVFSSDGAVQHQAHLLWPWLVVLMPVGGIVFAWDGVLLGAGDNAFMRTVTLLGALGGFVPLSLLALQEGWGISGVWAGLFAFIAIRFVGMALRVRGDRWLVVGNPL